MIPISQHLGDLEEIAENSARNGGYVGIELDLQPNVSAFAPELKILGNTPAAAYAPVSAYSPKLKTKVIEHEPAPASAFDPVIYCS